MFSIGFNVEENKLTDSYYDLLASEARQASLVAIAKKDVPTKHWNYLSRTLTVLGKYKGLISWSGTAFEYLMPNINIPKYEGSLLDESCKFMIMSQKEYAKRLNIPWGISEAAFNLKDLKSNYQYKAFGIPWLGLKRGLADELVVSSYAGVLAITDEPKETIKNLKQLENEGMYNKFGFYESIDFTPERVEKGKNMV
ncbi:MAG: glucoamylase family protein [Clostridia bacterium]